MPSWVEDPVEAHVPSRHHALLRRLFPEGGEGGGGGRPSRAVAATGTLLVCPMAPRVRGLDLMKDLRFDGLSLAFLKNLEKISFVSSVRAAARPSKPFRVSLCAARTLNTSGASRVTLSLR